MTQTPFFLFFRTNSKNKNWDSNLPLYFKRALIAVSVNIPMAFALNTPLSIFGTFLPVWTIIMINAVIISSYRTFIISKFSKAFATWLNSAIVRGVN